LGQLRLRILALIMPMIVSYQERRETMTPTLIYCAKKNKFAPIALEYGFEYGAQLPNSVYERPYFADQKFKKPNRGRYLAALEKYRPRLATVLDIDRIEQVEDVLSWASDASKLVSDAIILIPKALGVIDCLPREINGLEVRLGYSVETTHGKTDVDVHDFMGWPIHLLGGNPNEQLRLAHPFFDDRGRYVQLAVKSVDCNYHQKSAVKWCQFLDMATTDKQSSLFGYKAPTKWVQLKEIGLGDIPDAPYEAFRRSCATLAKLWAS